MTLLDVSGARIARLGGWRGDYGAKRWSGEHQACDGSNPGPGQ